MKKIFIAGIISILISPVLILLTNTVQPLITFILSSAGVSALVFVWYKAGDAGSRAETAENELNDLVKYKHLFDDGNDAILIVSYPDGSITEANQSAASLTGFTPDELKYMKLKDLISSDQIISNNKDWISKYAHKDSFNYDSLINRKEGAQIIVRVSGKPLDIHSKQYFQISIRDITEKKKSEGVLRESEEKFKKLTENSLAGVYLIQDDVFKYVNPEFARIFGYTAGEMINVLGPWAITTPDQYKIVKNNIERRLKGEIDSIHYEFQAKKKDGTEVDVEVYGSRLTYNGKNAIVGTLLDITNRKKAISKLRESERQYKELTSLLPQTVFEADLKGRITFSNEKGLTMFGYSREDFIGGISVFDCIEAADWEKAKQNIKSLIKRGEHKESEYTGRRKNGSTFPILIFSSIIYRSDKPAGIRGIIIDNSTSKRIERELITAKEKAEESDKLKSHFLAQVSHEIRTPLNIILSYNSFMRSELSDHFPDDFKHILPAIDSAGKRLFRTIDMILNMSIIETGKLHLKVKDVYLCRILNGLVHEYKGVINSPNVELIYSCYCDNPMLRTDEYMVQQIFQNLIDNALKYTHEGLVEVKIYYDGQKRVSVDVKDTGIGISEEYKSRMFKPFTQEETGYTRKYEGNGLGLALVKRYADIINADISVISEKGKGSTFTIAFNSPHQ